MLSVSYKVTAQPTNELISLDEAKDYLNVDFDSKDALIYRLIKSARRYAEKLLNRSLATQTIQMIYEPDAPPSGPLSGSVVDNRDSWEDAWNFLASSMPRVCIPVIMGPVQSLTSVEYQYSRSDVPEWTMLAATDASNNPNYRLDTIADPNELNVFAGLVASRYRLTYVAGDTTLADDLRPPMLALINYWYEYREGAPVPDGIRQQFCEKRVITL